ncbi:MAG: hypothetical protein RMK65_07755, partial [Anaerolineae bacterium]|nr:hypothetical protein [Anaerolineae bacterium]
GRPTGATSSPAVRPSPAAPPTPATTWRASSCRPGVSGSFTVTITATNIAGDGVPGNGDPTDQDRELVVYNAIPEPTGLLRGRSPTPARAIPLWGHEWWQRRASPGREPRPPAQGAYTSLTLPAATYIVTATAFGYLPPLPPHHGHRRNDNNPKLLPNPGAPVRPLRHPLRRRVWRAGPSTPALEITDGVSYRARLWTDPVSGFYSTTLPRRDGLYPHRPRLGDGLPAPGPHRWPS